MASSLHDDSSSSSSLRFLGLLRQPDSSDPDIPLELDESEVLWSSSFVDDGQSLPTSSPAAVVSPSNPSQGCHLHIHVHVHHQRHPPFTQQASGLSAALSNDRFPLVRRKSNLNATLSVATAAKTILPMPLLQSESHGSSRYHQSAPVKVPTWPKKLEKFDLLERFEEIECQLDDEAQRIPPHEIVARSHMAFSVFEGVGRTLKGSDLRRVRNAVFRRTGLLER